MGQVEAHEIEAGGDERLTISTRSGTEVDDRPTALSAEEGHELVAQFNSAARHRFA